MTAFLFYSFGILKISPYIIFLNSLAGFWRPPPGGARGQMPPPRYATGFMTENSKLYLIFDNEDGTFPKKILMRGFGEHLGNICACSQIEIGLHGA